MIRILHLEDNQNDADFVREILSLEEQAKLILFMESITWITL